MIQDSSKSGIGVLGGTFNPVHLGHLILAQTALEMLDVQKVLFVPCATPPHKDTTNLAAARHRLAMVDLAIEDSLCFERCDVDVQRGSISYSIDTARALREVYPDTPLHFIIGTDSLRELHLWKDVHALLGLCEFAAFGRPGCPVASLSAADVRLAPPWPERLLANAREGRLIGISSSDIRCRVAEGMSIRYLVPAAVEMYIAEHGLYGGR